MPLVSRIEIVKKSKQPVISIKTKTKIENLPIVIGETYGKIEEYLREIGEYPEDIPFVRYFNMDMENLKVEIGFPVYKELPEKDDIEFSYIEEMKAVYGLYQGPYQEMGETYDEIMIWIEDNGMKPTGIFLESYYNSPEDVSEDKLLTRILMPLD